ncbi:MAG TPA: PilN domain-containing protein [Methylomirabilota bacterium]|nr:PilN domain-containing protein [Methylomirabilota bacterium]
MIRINLAPDAKRRRVGFTLPALPAFNLGWLFLIVYVVAAGGLGAWWWTLSGEESTLTQEIDKKNTELAQLKATLGQGANVKAQVEELRKRLAVLEELTKGQARPIVLVDAFANMIPKDLWITGIEDRNQVLRISGSAFSTTAVADFMQNLRASGKFKDVDIIVSRRDLARPSPLVTFEVTCRFEG